MAKKRKEENFDEELQAMAMYLTILIKQVQPMIDQSETYGLLIDLFVTGLDTDTATQFGQEIRATAFSKLSQSKH